MLDDLAGDEKSDAERELAPTVDVPDESDADPELQRQFWVLVLVFNAALAAVSIGLMFVAFRGKWEFGGRIVVAGALLAAYGFYKYRAVTRKD